jgi:pimeloyl-ACP methyl ester carboxylesterase
MDRSLVHLQRRYFSPQDHRRYIVVGHSQGALLALALANEHPDRVVSVEAFGMPAYGTKIAPLWLPLPAVRAMNPRSRWLKDLRGHQDLDTSKVYSYFSALDVLVVPWVASMVKGAHNYLVLPSQIEGLVLTAGRAMLGDRIEEVEILHGTTGHIGLVTHPSVLGSVATRYGHREGKLAVVAS